MSGVALADVVAAMRAYLYLPSPDHVLFCAGVGVTAQLDGDPCWGLVVGAPSSGKTEVVRALDDTADEYMGDLSAPGLLSWLPGKPGKPPRPTGLLARSGGRVFATVGDLSSMLAGSDRGHRDMLYGLLRRAYDGHVVRELGNAPGPLTWRGRLTLLAAVTPAVDNYASHTDALGPRWLQLRVPVLTMDGRRRASRMARAKQGELARHRQEARALMRTVITDAVPRARAVTIAENMADALDDAALVACIGRAAIERDGYGRREIRSMPIIEEPPRLVGQMTLLCRGLLGLGLDQGEAVRLARRAALDSIPQARRRVLEALSDGGELTASQIARTIGLDRKVARFALEELAATGIARFQGDELDGDDDASRRTPKPWRLDGPDTELVERVIRADRGGTKSVKHPPQPTNERAIRGGAGHTSSHPQAVEPW